MDFKRNLRIVGTLAVLAGMSWILAGCAGIAIPTAAFTASPTIGSAALAVQFTDLSEGNVSDWLWDFGDGGTSTEQNPTHTYTDAGFYDVSLTVRYGGLTPSTETKQDYIKVASGGGYVTPLGEGGDTDSIDAAVDGAPAGGLVLVTAGTYTEDVSIPAGKDGLTLRAASRPVIDGDLIVDSDDVTVDGFEVTGDLETTFDSFANLTLIDTLIYGQVFDITLSCDDVVNEAESIQTSIDGAAGGETICVGPGTYGESLNIDKALSVVGLGGANNVSITGGIQIAGSGWSGLTLEGLYLSGDAPGSKDAVIDSRPTTGPVSDITIRDCVLDGQDVGTRMAFYGHFIAGNWTWEGNEIKNFANWYLIDNTSSTHDVPYKLDTVTWDNNHVHHVSGSIAFRGKIDEPTDLVVVKNSVFDQYVNRSGSTGWIWACIEINSATNVQIYNNTMTGVPPQLGGGYGDEGQGLQIWSATPWTVDVHDNTITDNYEGILIWSLLPGTAWSGPDTPLYVPSGSIYRNNISGNAAYGLWIGDSPTVGSASSAISGPLDAENNWWGDASGPEDTSGTTECSYDEVTDTWTCDGLNADGTGDKVSDNVDYCPWSLSEN